MNDRNIFLVNADGGDRLAVGYDAGGANNGVDGFSVCEVVQVSGHGTAVVTGVACCGHDGSIEVAYPDETSYHVRPDMLSRRSTSNANLGKLDLGKTRWADTCAPRGLILD